MLEEHLRGFDDLPVGGHLADLAQPRCFVRPAEAQQHISRYNTGFCPGHRKIPRGGRI